MSREEVCLRPQFKRVLRLYGFDDPNSFLVDSCPDAAATTTMQPMSVTTHGTVVTEMTPSSQTIQVNANITDKPTVAAASTTAPVTAVSTTAPVTAASTTAPVTAAKVTYLGDASFTISNVDTNTNIPMNSQTNTMTVDIGTRPFSVRPMMTGGSSTDQTGTTKYLAGDQEPKSSEEVEITDTKPMEWIATEPIVAGTTAGIAASMTTGIVDGTTPPMISDDPMTAAAATVTLQTSTNYGNATTKAASDVTTTPAESAPSTDVPTTLKGDKYVFAGNDDDEVDGTTRDDNETGGTTRGETVPSTRSTSSGTEGQTTAIPQTTAVPTDSPAATSDDGGDSSMTTTEVGENPTSGYDNDSDGSSTTTVMSSGNTTENEIIKEAESNQHYLVASLEKKNARSMIASNEDYLPTFNVEFIVRKEDLRADCNNRTRKRTVIKPDRILTEYPKNSGISISLREPNKRKRRRHLEQCNV